MDGCRPANVLHVWSLEEAVTTLVMLQARQCFGVHVRFGHAVDAREQALVGGQLGDGLVTTYGSPLVSGAGCVDGLHVEQGFSAAAGARVFRADRVEEYFIGDSFDDTALPAAPPFPFLQQGGLGHDSDVDSGTFVGESGLMNDTRQYFEHPRPPEVCIGSEDGLVVRTAASQGSVDHDHDFAGTDGHGCSDGRTGTRKYLEEYSGDPGVNDDDYYEHASDLRGNVNNYVECTAVLTGTGDD